jgi:NAD(P)-dependent dehydrogenase (short-subunit alcohol dehydrogenase family)
MSELDGRAVVVTGAGRGLGRAYSQHIAAAGARTVVNDVDAEEARDTAASIRAAGGVAVASGHDVSEADQASELIALCCERFGTLDGLVNNAGLYYEAVPWHDDPAQMRRLVSVNVLGTMYCTAAAARVMAGQRRGSVVNASSGGCFGFPTISAYAASKGAIASFTYACALDMEEIGVRVNAISPMAMTRMTSSALGRSLVPEGSGKPLLDGLAQRAPERIAPLVTFLLSDLADGLTGQFLRFDGFKISVVRQYPFAEHPSAEAATWDVGAISVAFAGQLRTRLEAYGVQRVLPPRARPQAGADPAAIRTEGP